MLKVRENAIHCVNGKCVFPFKENLHQNYNSQYNDIYGNKQYLQSRFNDLGIPLFVLQDEQPVIEETIHIQNDYVIDDNLFDQLLEKVEKPRKKTKKGTKKKRK